MNSPIPHCPLPEGERGLKNEKNNTPANYSPSLWERGVGGEAIGRGVRLFIVFIITTMQLSAQIPPPPEQMLLGRKGFTSLMGLADYKWYDENIAKAKADTAECKACKEIGAIKTPYKIVVVGGTWCSDTQDLLPKYYVAMQRAGINPDTNTELYFVNRDKNEPADVATKYAVTNIPVFIVYNAQGEEVGRITESVKVSIADDLLEILRKL